MILKDSLTTMEARTGLYNGVETALAFTDSAGELRALRSSHGVFALPWRTKITVAGADRVRWLNGMVSNNTRDLPVHRGCYNFLLNPQGHILGDMLVYNQGESYLLDTDGFQLEKIMGALRRYIIMDKVELSSLGPSLASLGICGPKAGEALEAAGFSVAGLAPLEMRRVAPGQFGAESDQEDGWVARGPDRWPGWHEIWASPGGVERAWSLLREAGAQPVVAEALEWWRILQGIPRYGLDIRERDLPQETGQAQALNFTKGCYIGQEIVERIRSRGQVHRKFTGFQFHPEPEGAARDLADNPALAGPRKFEQSGRVVAEITSACRVPEGAGQARIALGYVRQEVVAPDGTVALDGQLAA